jgi:hypothetical protein
MMKTLAPNPFTQSEKPSLYNRSSHPFGTVTQGGISPWPQQEAVVSISSFQSF